MVDEPALKRSIEIFFAVLYGGVLSYFITKFYERPSWTNFGFTLGFGLFVILYFYVWFKKFGK